MELRILYFLAVHEPSVIAPGSVKQLVAFYTDHEPFGYVFVIDQAVPKIGKACARAARDDLLKRVEWVKGAKGLPNLRRRRAAEGRFGRAGLNCEGERLPRRDEERRTARGLKAARGHWRKFVVGLRIDIIKVAVNPQLIITDLVLERRVTSPAFLFRERTREEVKVEAREQASKRSNTFLEVDVIAGRRQAIGPGRRRAELRRGRYREWRSPRFLYGGYCQLKIVGAGV